jgi:hypothetical protein
MIPIMNTEKYKRLSVGGLFVVFFLYFAVFNRYHILYLEQSQLFIYNIDFIKDKFSLPGGLAFYLGSFFTQFFISSLAGAFIITMNAFAVYKLTIYILQKHRISNIVSAIVPVWLLAILQSNELFLFAQSMGYLMLLSFFALYISVNKSGLRYIFYFTSWPVLYLLIGGFSIPLILMCAIHELLFKKEKHYRLISLFYIIEGVIIPYAAASILFFISSDKIFIYPVIIELHSFYLYALILLIVWIPLMSIANYFLNISRPNIFRLKDRKLPDMLLVASIFAIMVFCIAEYGYNKRTELMLGIDYHVQHEEWAKVLKLSDHYPDFNRMVVYATNLALYKSGNLLENLFNYPQAGASGLRLKSERSSGFFFGGDVFYYLSYTSEARRWAFETMIARGLNPRALKRLITTSMVYRETDIAAKYLNILNRTLFYRKFTNKYINYLKNPGLADKDRDISMQRSLMIHSDFVSNENDLNLLDLLSNHPDNKMAYEYLLASLLLDKRLDEFVKYVSMIKDYGYTTLPVHIEEALVFYNSFENKNIMPAGFSINPKTILRFKDYINSYNSSKGNMQVAARELNGKYGKTYWYYLRFMNILQK